MDFPGHFQLIFRELNQQRLRAQLCDCVVLVGGRSFPAHRSILAACSSHFRALLSSGDSGDQTGVQIGGPKACPSVMELDPGVVTAEAFSTLLDMIYTSNLSLSATNVMDVLLAASHLHLNTVVKACKIHLSKKNFPTSPPKGWRSVQQQQHPPASVNGAVTSADRDLDVEEVGAEVSQSNGQEDREVGTKLKRKSDECDLGGTKRSRRLSGCSPSGTGEGGEGLLSSDCLKTTGGPWEDRNEEVEKKYEAAKGESEEIELPSQSDSSTGGVGPWEQSEGTSGEGVFKIKVGDEGENGAGEPTILMVEVKKENLSSYPLDIETAPNSSAPFSPKDFMDSLDSQFDVRKTSTACVQEADVGSFQPPLCPDPPSDAQEEALDLGEESADADEGLDSLSELAFSCFLNPSSDSVLGALEEDTSLASLTAAVTAAAAAASDVPAAACEEPCENSGAQPSPSLMFPVSSVPVQQQQQLLQTQGSGFTDTLILQPSQNSLTGFLSGIRSGLCVKTSLVPPSSAGKSIGGKSLRRIAPKVPPGSETDADPSTAQAGDEGDRPSLTRASEDVLLKCKKAAAEDHVLLVEGEKKYACKICCKTFMSLTDCKKHIRVHTGEKPYPCPKCGKRFSQSSHLYKHSKNTCLSWKDVQSLPDKLL